MAEQEPLCIGQIPALAAHIKTMTTATAKLLHQLIFNRDDGRKNRGNLRKFTGFDFEENSDEYVEKLNRMKEIYAEKDLILICTIFGLNSGETKEETIKKILTHLIDLEMLMNIENDDDDDYDKDDKINDDKIDDDNDDYDENDDNDDKDDNVDDDSEDGCEAQYSAEKTRKTVNRCTINFKDVEDSIRTFDGKSNYAVENWIKDFEDLSNLLGWSELQKLIFAKKSLKGLAKLYIQSERKIVSWEKLKKTLLEEFGEKMSVVNLHKALQKRKMKDNEDVYEHFLVMKELASRGAIDNGSLTQYVIEGIQDTHVNKMMLYGTKNLKKFKERLQRYKSYRAEYNKVSKPRPTLVVKNLGQRVIKKNKGESRGGEQCCYSCGEVGHRANECDKRDQGKKCFRCNKFGHISVQCKEVSIVKQEQDMQKKASTAPAINKMCKDVKINNMIVTALIDTGSEVNIIHEKIVKQTGLEPKKASNIILTGFGGTQISSSSIVRAKIIIDEEVYDVSMRDSMKVKMILGNEFFNEAEVSIKKDEVKISRIDKSAYILKIETSVEKEKDLRHIENENNQEEIKDLIKNYNPVKTKTLDLEMKITLTDETPIYNNPRRLPFAERDIVDKQMEEWVTNDIIEPCISEFASQVVLVKKKDGSPRICIDYRKINKVAVKDYPMPILED